MKTCIALFHVCNFGLVWHGQLHNDITASASDRRGLLEAELQRLHDDRKKSYFDKDRDIRIRKELDRLSSANYSGSLSAVQRSVFMNSPHLFQTMI